MAVSYNFELSDRTPLSKTCLKRGLTHFKQVCEYVSQLPYGRNSDKKSLSLVLSEQKGTCSTKHGFLSQIARENNVLDIPLVIGIYSMNNKNTPGIGNVLEEHNLQYIPEAHTYLKHEGSILDFTSNKPSSFEKHLLFEEEILPQQISDYKVNLHKSYIKKWIIEKSITYSFEDIWQIREHCILNLSQ